MTERKELIGKEMEMDLIDEFENGKLKMDDYRLKQLLKELKIVIFNTGSTKEIAEKFEIDCCTTQGLLDELIERGTTLLEFYEKQFIVSIMIRKEIRYYLTH